MDDKPTDYNSTDPEISSAPPLPEHDPAQPSEASTPTLPPDSAEQPEQPPQAKTTLPDYPKPPKPRRNPLKRAIAAWWHKKRWTLPLSLVIILAILAAIPLTRYSLAGLVLKQNFSVEVIDATTGKPVSSAAVTIGRLTAMTSNQGQVGLHVNVGTRNLSISKQYYKTYQSAVLVPIFAQKAVWIVKLTATGRQVPIVITNSINGQPVPNALVRVADTEATTDQKGQVTIVLPANDIQLSANFSASGYNNASGTILVTAQSNPQNHFQITPAGKLYFLSQLSGTMDVVTTNLDGTNRQTVLAGTGNESNTDTVLMSSRDWKYLALESNRIHSNQPELYLIDTTANDQLTTIDISNANYNPIGWIGDSFVYSITRNGIQNWQPAAEILKSYNAVTGKLTVLDQTTASGTDSSNYAMTTFGSAYLINNAVIYTLDWSGSDISQLNGKSDSLISIKPDGSSKQDIRDFPVPASLSYASYYLSTAQYALPSLYIQVPDGSGNNSYYSLTNGTLTSANISDATFFNQSPTYISSPDGALSFWSEQRDSKNTLFIGDGSGQNGKQIATLSAYTPYGWFTDNYLLVSKDSELYVMPASGGTALKVTDYFSNLPPGYNFGGQ
jgi:hypothetical protein